MDRLLFVVLAFATLATTGASLHEHAQKQHTEEHVGIHVASWKWDDIGVLYTFTVFIVLCGLAKIAFHHAHFLSAHIPESCLMILVGVLFGVTIFFAYQKPIVDESGVATTNFEIPRFTPKTFFLILLPPVILEAAYSLYDRAFADNIGTVMLYSVVGTLINTFTIGPLLFLLFYAGAMGDMVLIPLHVEGLRPMPYDLTMTDCLVFSALISAVDPVAVLAIFQEIGVNKDLYYLVFGESLFNDAVTVVLYSTMVAFSEMPAVAGGEYGLAVLAFFASSCGGLAIGVFFGLLTALITRTTKEIRVVEPLAVLGIAYLSYLSAELFHFSGIISIIGCGLTQAHYALKNISHKSYITVIYFTKMLSSTSDAIIFLFLGMVVVADHHVWHTGFVIWTLVLCLVCRFAGVYVLTALANAFRVSPINLQEQFLMAYGGLRGAVAFSLVQMLDPKSVEPRQVFVTTTLVVIFFTVFIQGSTIKPLVTWLKIKKDTAGKKQMCDEINENIVSNLMAGIEEITGIRGDNYIRHKIELFDERYLQRVFLVPDQESDMTKLYKELSLVEHFAHLYGPVALVEDRNAELLRQESFRDGEPVEARVIRQESILRRKESFLRREPEGSATLPAGVELRNRARGSTLRGPVLVRSNTATIDVSRAEDLRNAFKNYPGKKFPSRDADERQQLRHQLLQRHMTARAITAMVNRQSLPAWETPNGAMPTGPVPATAMPANRQSLPAEVSDVSSVVSSPTPRRLVHSDVEERYPEEVEGLDAIMRRASLRRQRSRSASDEQSPFVTRPEVILDDIHETEMDVFLPKSTTH